MKRILLLNGGPKTQRAFEMGVENTNVETRRSKEIILHIKKNLTQSYINRNEEIVLDTDMYVFTRLNATDSHFCGILYEHLVANGIKASDPINLSFKMAEEKIAQMPRLARAGIQIPETIIAREESYEANKEYILQNISFPCVFKTDGKKGDAVFKIDSPEELEEKIASKRTHELFLIQEFIPNTFDTRTLIAYGKVLGTIKRTAQAGNFYNNVSKGASVEMYTLTEAESDVALRSTKACKLDFGGVDIIHTQNGPVVLEVNKSPQIKGFESIYGKRFVFKEIAKIIEKEIL